jgi:hypothetical protein
MRTMQGPDCQLRFSTTSEARWHLRHDHRRTRGWTCPAGWVARPGGATGGPRRLGKAVASTASVTPPYRGRTAWRSGADVPFAGLPAAATLAVAAFR